MRLRVPKGSCDTHMHFYDENLPAAPGTFLPGTFSVEEYRVLQKRLGLERVIVVQANAYADDNSIAVNAIRALGKGAKEGGVAYGAHVGGFVVGMALVKIMERR